MKKPSKFFCLTITTALLVSCNSSENLQGIELRQGELQLIQNKLRENAMKNWEANLPKYLANEVLPEPMQTKEAREQVKNDPATIAWRAKLSEQWQEIQGQRNLDLMCQLWFEGWLGLGDTFADLFKEHRARTAAMGISIETIENIVMLEDNRKTINYPAEGTTSKLFVCEALTVWKLARPGLTMPYKSFISFDIKLVNNQEKASFSVSPGISTLEVQGSQPLK